MLPLLTAAISAQLSTPLTLNGHRTSVSLEPEFWLELRRLSEERSKPVNALAAEIDAMRAADTGLATAIRLFVLSCLRAEASPDDR